jgi:hypothetical protein
MNLSKEDRKWLADMVIFWVFVLSLAGIGILWREHLGILSYVFVLTPLLLSVRYLYERVRDQWAIKNPDDKKKQEQPEYRNGGEKV